MLAFRSRYQVSGGERRIETCRDPGIGVDCLSADQYSTDYEKVSCLREVRNLERGDQFLSIIIAPFSW